MTNFSRICSKNGTIRDVFLKVGGKYDVYYLVSSDMEFVKIITPPEFQAKTFTPSISANFNSFGDKNTKKMSENGEIYTAGKNDISHFSHI